MSQSLLNEVVLKAALPVDGLFPTTFAIRIYDDFENNEKLKLPNKFRGVLLIQKLEDRRKNAVLRFEFANFPVYLILIAISHVELE